MSNKVTKKKIYPGTVKNYFDFSLRPMINQVCKRIVIRRQLTHVIGALAQKTAREYNTYGITPNHGWITIYTSRPELASLGDVGHPTTVYRQLQKLEDFGLIHIPGQNNSADGTRTVRNPKCRFAVWIRCWLLCGEAPPATYLDEISKKFNPSNSANLGHFGAKCSVLSYSKNQNSINNAVDLLPTPGPDDNTSLVTPPRKDQGTIELKNPRTGEPKADKVSRRSEPSPAVSPQPVTNPASQDGTGVRLEPENRTEEQKEPNQAGGRGAGTRLREKMYGKPEKQAEDQLKAQLRLIMLAFWEYARVRLYDDTRYKSQDEERIRKIIWEGVFNNGVSKQNWSLKGWQKFSEMLHERVDMVAAYVERKDFRLMQPHVYFDINNTKCGFAKTYEWWIAAQGRRELAKALRSVKSGKPPKGNAPMSELQLYSYWRNRLSKMRHQESYDAFNAFVYSQTRNHTPSNASN